MKPKRYLDWQAFDAAVYRMGEIFQTVARGRYKGIYGEPRGGLALALALSHRLDLPLLTGFPVRERIIWVDDIFDSQCTWELARLKATDFETELLGLAWVSRGEPPNGTYVASRVDGDEWLVFPWERWSDPDTEMARYQAHIPRTVT